MSSSCAANSEHVSRVVVVVGEGPAELVFCLRLYLPSLSISETEKVGTESRIVVIRRGLVRHYIHSTTCLPPSEGYFKETPSQRLKPAFGVSWNSRWGQSTIDTNQINCGSLPFLNHREKCSNEVTYDIFSQSLYFISGKQNRIRISINSSSAPRPPPTHRYSCRIVSRPRGSPSSVCSVARFRQGLHVKNDMTLRWW